MHPDSVPFDGQPKALVGGCQHGTIVREVNSRPLAVAFPRREFIEGLPRLGAWVPNAIALRGGSVGVSHGAAEAGAAFASNIDWKDRCHVRAEKRRAHAGEAFWCVGAEEGPPAVTLGCDEVLGDQKL